MGAMKQAYTKRMNVGKSGPLQILGSVGVFFDGDEINKRKDKQKLKAMMTAGAFLMREARGLIKPAGKKNKVSDPGKPPRWHVKPGIKTIFFVHEKSRGSVVVGPVKFNSGGPKILETLDRGGSIKAIRRNRRTGRKESRVVKIKPRPFMGPAKDKALPKLVEKNPYLEKLISGADVRLP